MRKNKIIKALITLALICAAIHLTRSVYAQNTSEEAKMNMATLADSLRDTASIEALLKALYESITFVEGAEPDLSRFRNLFTAAAPCIRVNQNQSVDRMTVDTFILSFRKRIESRALQSFHESEIARQTRLWGQMAQVFSTYRKGANVIDPKKMSRGINNLQLVYDGGRWWIASLMWMDERPDLPIPAEYLR